MGNHDHNAHNFLKQLLFELTEENIKKYFAGDLMNFYQEVNGWTQFGGQPTLNDFGKLPIDERQYIVEYLSEFALYETVEIKGKLFILTHAGLPAGATLHNLDSFDPYDFLIAETDYARRYFGEDIYLVSGHLPTFNIAESSRGKIYRANNHIAIDTGAAFDEAMGCLCLDTGEEFYVR